MIVLVKRYGRRSGLFCLLVLLAAFCQAAWAAPAANRVKEARFSQSAMAVRMVLDVDAIPAYRAAASADGRQIVLTLAGTTADLKSLKKMPFQDPAVQDVAFRQTAAGLQAVISLRQPGLPYTVRVLHRPERVYIDIAKEYDIKTRETVAPGITHIVWRRGRKSGPVTANIVMIDRDAARLRPVLSNDRTAGLETVRSMAERTGAVVAVNASYFNSNGEVLGLTKIDGLIVSTAGLPRAAVGIRDDGAAVVGTVDYSGAVVWNGGRLAVSGVNCERGENGVILYNQWYGKSTRTNPFGREYVIEDGKVAAIYDGDSPLTPGALVVSVHGAARQAMAGVRIGDAVTVTQKLSGDWDRIPQILGVGPLLVENGAVRVTAAEERFGRDVAAGRAPRTAFGVTKDGGVLLVVADGRQKQSVGFTLQELAQFMVENGAAAALNFDGGGSSEMVVNGQIANSPSDGRERRVGTGLVALTK